LVARHSLQAILSLIRCCLLIGEHKDAFRWLDKFVPAIKQIFWDSKIAKVG
jgi:hypothetical protein